MLLKAFKLDIRNGRVFQDTAGQWARDYISTAAVFGIGIKGKLISEAVRF